VFTHIGAEYTGKGAAGLFDANWRKFAWDNSNLRARTFDIHVSDALRSPHGAPAGMISASGRVTKRLTGNKQTAVKVARGTAKAYEVASEAKRKAGIVGLKPLQLLDEQTATAAWIGAYRYASEGLKLDKRNAINYANDLITQTQGSATRANLPPIQRDALGKAFTLFQTFNLYDWQLMLRDVYGIKSVESLSAGQRAARLARYLTATALGTTAFGMIGQYSPFTNPIGAYNDAIEQGRTDQEATLAAVRETVGIVPIIGRSAKFGSTPLGASAQYLSELMQFAAGDYRAYPALYLAGKGLGIVGTQQTYKMIRKDKRDMEAAAEARKEANKTTRRERRSATRERRTRRTR